MKCEIANLPDVDRLLIPISEAQPGGEDSRKDPSSHSLYHEIRDARSAARAAERQVVEAGQEDPTVREQWRNVLARGQELLATKSKDLEICAYVTEALVRLHGFPGLAAGFRLTRQLVELFWDGLFPEPDEDGVATRVAPLAGLNGVDAEGTLSTPILGVPLTAEGSYSAAHHHQAAQLRRLSEEQRHNRIRQGSVAPEEFDQAVADTPPGFFQETLESLQECIREFKALDLTLQERAGAAAPPSSNIRAALETCLQALKDMARDKLSQPGPENAPKVEEEESEPEGRDGQTPGTGRHIYRREEAFELLLQVADFFRRTEPHNPVSYGLQQVVRWGRMSLPELMNELIPDDESRGVFFRQVGIRERD